MLRLLIAFLLALPTPARAEEVVVFAASSMMTALDAVVMAFETETGHEVATAYAGSSLLAKQILAGAPADIFISANPAWMDAVDNLIPDGARRDLLGNTLVLIAPKGSAPVALGPGLAARLGDGKLAMALVDAVPAGQYGKAALTSLGLWDSVEAAVAQTDNARSTLALVSTGAAPLGIVYATDAAADENVDAVATFPADSHPAITYPAARLTDTEAARALYEALASNTARAIFAANGFKVLD